MPADGWTLDLVKARVDEKKCDCCALCLDVCPYEALAIERDEGNHRRGKWERETKARCPGGKMQRMRDLPGDMSQGRHKRDGLFLRPALGPGASRAGDGRNRLTAKTRGSGAATKGKAAHKDAKETQRARRKS